MPNRLEAAKQAILKFIETRRKVDPSTAFALITFGNGAKNVITFSQNAGVEEFMMAFDDIIIQGASALGDGVGLAIKALLEQIRATGAKTPCIQIVSDGIFTQSAVNPMQMAKLAAKMYIRIDTMRLGPVEHFNVLKRLSDLTSGKYVYSTNSEQLLLSAHEMADDNLKAHGAAYQTNRSSDVLYKIAADLVTVDQLKSGNDSQQKIIETLKGKTSFSQCTMCYSESCLICQGAFNQCLRHCPNCGTSIHLHCAAMWAQTQADPSNVSKLGLTFRCPHCFYLIRVPQAVVQATKMHMESSNTKKTTVDSDDIPVYAKRVVAESLGDAILVTACPVCNSIYDDDEMVVVCGNLDCSAIYHEKCFEELEESRCKICGSKLELAF